jgi:hypothetical protein
MKATTFVSRKLHRIRETLGLLHGERHTRLALLREIVEEILFFMAIEENLLYPALRAHLDRDFRPVRGELTRIQVALRGLVGASTEPELRARLHVLEKALGDHAATAKHLLPMAEQRIAASTLEELGQRMARFYRDSVSAAHGRDEKPRRDLSAH